MTDTHPVVVGEDRVAPPLKLRLLLAQVGACKCDTKTDEIEFHDVYCPARLYIEALDEFDALQKQLDMAVEALEQTLERLIGVEDWRDGSRPRVPSSDAAIAFARKALAAIKEQGA